MSLVLFFLSVLRVRPEPCPCSTEQATAAHAARARCQGSPSAERWLGCPSAFGGGSGLPGNRGQGDMPHPQHAMKCSHREHRAS